MTYSQSWPEAATVPGMSVIVTARRDFGIAEPNWLPAEALDKLGRTTPVIIEELSDNETDERRSAAPQLSSLLSDIHPARQVAHNLFRLSRLANRPSGLRSAPKPTWRRNGGNRPTVRRIKAIAIAPAC